MKYKYLGYLELLRDLFNDTPRDPHPTEFNPRARIFSARAAEHGVLPCIVPRDGVLRPALTPVGLRSWSMGCSAPVVVIRVVGVVLRSHVLYVGGRNGRESGKGVHSEVMADGNGHDNDGVSS